ncbi:hypothetical protein LEP1GSC045_0344 [Leptospira interrogans serovar Pomona str. Kennewicki LC82-25]|nr:hypothetical protein LEP1GSC045_0344 [Leptospira interrogans serovar Pomona str. Kennewicki LC82-25]EKN97077.1 hypothetical protein LEP1GSC014_0034 [Leptospira interrogans serovar Pomona str. Pomona]EMI71263.1 hypothetical protein LEP1GSC200_1538 [Leptospira interrogans serovar Pomona str. CSL10083]
MRIRAEQPLLSHLLKLAGKNLEVPQDKIQLGIPIIGLLKPHKTLYNRLIGSANI